jgi:hypothetical protein
VYGYPLDQAAAISLAVARQGDWALDEIRFVLFSEEVFNAWQSALG